MKYVLIMLLCITTHAGSGSDIDTTRVLDLRQYSTGGDLDTLRILGGGGDVDDARVLKVGDYLQINNKNEYVIKTVSRHLIVDDFKLVNKFKVLNRIINENKDDLKFFKDDITIEEVVEEIRVDIIPFDVEDF